ncbi:MAG: alpha/beta fold hydrolase [Gammaproteobacteria bacterium]
MNNFERGYNYQEVNNIQIHYSLEGDKDKPNLVLINMASHNLTSWEAVLDDLIKDFYILRFDGRGTGLSGWGNDEEFTFSQYADDLSELMKGLNIDKAFVLGIAYGARTAAQFALRHSNQLKALALCDVALSQPVNQVEQANLGQKARELLADADEPKVDYQKYWRFYKNKDQALNFHKAHLSEEDVTNNLSKVSIPSLITCGRQDMNLDEAKRISKKIKNSTFQIMEMTGHASILFRPKLFSNIVKEFYYSNFGEENE